MAPLSPWKEADQVARELSADGTFSVKSAYDSLDTGSSANDHVFWHIWDWNGPEMIQTFL